MFKLLGFFCYDCLSQLLNNKGVGFMQLLKVYIQETVMRLTTELVPLFFLTYVAHILHVQALGMQAGTFALVMLSIGVVATAIRIYAQSELSKMAPDKRTNSSFFWGVWSIQVSVLAILALVTWGLINGLNLPFESVFKAQVLFYVGAMLDISWLYNGINKTRVIVRRDALVQMLRFVPLIIFVKSPSDLTHFIILLAMTTIIANLLLWARLPKVLVRVNVTNLPVKLHYKALGFFLAIALLPQLSLYLNKAVLFVSLGAHEVALYYSAELLIKVGIAFVLGIAMAMMTKVQEQRRAGDSAGVEKSFYEAIEYSSALSVIVAVGVATVGPQAVYWFLGPTFVGVGEVLRILAFIIIVASWRYSLALQQMAADRGFRNVSIPVQVGAAINVVLSLALIPHFGMLMAAWVALISEIVALLLQVMVLRHVLNPWQFIRFVWRYIVAGAVAWLAITLVIHGVPGPYPKFSALEAAVGLIVYTIVVFVFSTQVAKVVNTVIVLAVHRMFESTIEFIRIMLRIKK